MNNDTLYPKEIIRLTWQVDDVNQCNTYIVQDNLVQRALHGDLMVDGPQQGIQWKSLICLAFNACNSNDIKVSNFLLILMLHVSHPH